MTGRRPWPGPRWDGFRVVLEGDERPSFLGLHDGEAVSWSEDDRVVYLFGRPGRIVTPLGRGSRREPTELVIERIEVERDGSPARLVADFNADRLYLEIGEERRKGQLKALLGALPLFQLPPATGRPAGHKPPDCPAVEREVVAAIRAHRAERTGPATQELIAGRCHQSERELRRDLAECGLDWRTLLRTS